MPTITERAPQDVWDSITRILESKSTFLITTHVNPDGDGLGAELGLYAFLRSRGKHPRIINQDPLPRRYAFLGRQADFEVYEAPKHDAYAAKVDVAVILDTGRWDRIGALAQVIQRESMEVMCLDHHPIDEEAGFNYYGLDVTAAATGLVVYELLSGAEFDLTYDMALGFYTSILTDTGSFRFSNTDPRTHRAAAEFLAAGVSAADVYNRVYGEWSRAKLKLAAQVMNRVGLSDSGKALVASVSLRSLEETGAVEEDVEGLIDLVRNTRGVEAVGFLREESPGVFKVSFRSRGHVDVRRIAAGFDGGGHIYAAGGRVNGDEAEARRAVLQALEEATASNA